VPHGSVGYLHATEIDHTPRLLESSYRLRYQVYCLERGFLRPEDYPLGLETDEFDCVSSHVGAVDAHGELAGTARLVKNTAAGFPLFHHCSIFPQERARDTPNDRVVEIGRLSVSRHYRRRLADAAAITGNDQSPQRAAGYQGENRRSGRGGVLLTIIKAVYQQSKRMGATEWLAATEPSLQRVLARHGVPFRQIGPESDYFGLVAPYVMDVEEFDQIILSGRFPELEGFDLGLEARLRLSSGASQAPARRSVDPVEPTDSPRSFRGGDRGAA
jgi:N-acyl amino acid synthase of PEP-CTERM/exosortase system